MIVKKDKIENIDNNSNNEVLIIDKNSKKKNIDNEEGDNKNSKDIGNAK